MSSPASILFDVFGSKIATVSGVDGVRLATDVDGLVGIDPSNVGGLALETTASGIAQTLTALDGKDFATETKLEAVRVLLASIDAKDFATETKLEQVRVLLASLDGKDFATEATLSGIAQTATSLDGTDFATETTLSALRTDFNAEDFATETTQQTLATEATVATLGTELTLSGLAETATSLDGKDFATETTLSALRADFNAEDFATETTLSGVNISLTDIRDNQGIKRINDQLPVGSNVIGKVQLRDPSNTVDLGDSTNPLRTNATGNNETSGSITALNETVEIDTHGAAGITAQISGTWTGTLVGEATLDGSIWFVIAGFQIGGSGVVTSTTTNGNFRANVEGFRAMRVRASAWTSGTATVVINSSVRIGQIPIDGNGNIGVRVVSTAPPAGVDATIIAADTPLTVGSHDTNYTIPNGETFYLQQLTGGNEDPSKGASVTIIYYDGTTEHIVHRDYYAGSTHSTIFPDVGSARDGTVMVGDGSTKLIRIRRAKFSGTDIAIDAVVYGYTQ